jgi:enoyl-CoA hydratase/carnithine racemase
MDYEQIRFDQRGRVGLITLNRPEKLNAWTPRMMAEYRDAIERCNDDSNIGAIVMTGAGRAFCAGADIASVFRAQTERSAAGEDKHENAGGGPTERSSASEDYLDFLARMPKPTIAAINGAAVGVGITQVLPFDIRIASEDARIGFFFVKMGLVPELASSHLLSRLAGAGRALEWCLTGRMISAPEARASGLVTEVVPTDKLVDRALALGEELADQPLDAIRLIKALLRQNADEPNLAEVQRREAEALREAYASPEHHEAVKAFLEKRRPDFAKVRTQSLDRVSVGPAPATPRRTAP